LKCRPLTGAYGHERVRRACPQAFANHQSGDSAGADTLESGHADGHGDIAGADAVREAELICRRLRAAA